MRGELETKEMAAKMAREKALACGAARELCRSHSNDRTYHSAQKHAFGEISRAIDCLTPPAPEETG